MRNLGAAILATALFVSSATAANTTSLAPGKPAGVQQAQLHGHALLWLFGLGIVAGGIALVASGNGNNHQTVTTTTSTTP
jgi:hypothetical protein